MKPVEQLRVDRLAQGGDGVGRLEDGRVVFVDGGLPGDVLDVRLTKRKRTWVRAEIVRVVEPGPGRVEPDCVHAAECGGCAFRHAAYDVELHGKVSAARDTLARLGAISLDGVEVNVHAADAVDEYRIRARFHVERGVLGFRRRRSHRVFDLRSCRTLDPRIASALPALKQFANVIGDGELFVETADDQVVVSLDPSVEVDDGELASLAGDPAIRGVRRGQERLGDPSVAALDAVGVDVPIRLPGGRFRQAHRSMTRTLRNIAAARVADAGRVMEFFAGSGNLTFAFSRGASSVIAYELDAEAVAMGNEIARNLEFGHVSFHEADLFGDGLGALPPIPRGATVVLDPPRAGAASLVEVLASSDAARIVYVSCDVATLARDLRTLTDDGAWTVASVDFVDLFPRTPHLESVVSLRRCSPAPS